MSEEKKKDTSKKWKVTTKRFVAYIDIMGFKDMVARSSHEQIYQMMKRIDQRKKSNEQINWGKTEQRLIRTTTYSDSIMIYSMDDSYESLHSFNCTVAALAYDLFIEGVPHKGAVAFGMMTLNTTKSIFFGQPLIDAYLLQDELNFYGIIVHASAEQEMENKKQDSHKLFLRNYLCPLKNGNSYHLTIHPMFAQKTSYKIENPSHEGLIKRNDKLFESIKKLRYQTSGHLRKYIDNTEAYLNFINGIEVKKP